MHRSGTKSSSKHYRYRKHWYCDVYTRVSIQYTGTARYTRHTPVSSILVPRGIHTIHHILGSERAETQRADLLTVLSNQFQRQKFGAQKEETAERGSSVYPPANPLKTQSGPYSNLHRLNLHRQRLIARTASE